MSKLTAEKCREFISVFKSLEKEGHLALTSGYHLQALEIALPILEQQERGGLVRVAFTGSGSLEAIKHGGEGFIWGSREDAHPIELFVNSKDAICQKCNGTGEMDSGGTQPWGDSITVTCDCQSQTSPNPLIDNDGWIEWGGGECPVSPECVVDVKWRAGGKMTIEAGGRSWAHDGKFYDIIAYRVIEQQEKASGKHQEGE